MRFLLGLGLAALADMLRTLSLLCQTLSRAIA